MGILNFKSQSLEDLSSCAMTKKTLSLLPKELHRIAIKKINILRAAKDLKDIANFPGLKLEKLKGQRKDEYSIRINVQYRICFKWNGSNCFDVNIEDYH